jgi:hypothetical protein
MNTLIFLLEWSDQFQPFSLVQSLGSLILYFFCEWSTKKALAAASVKACQIGVCSGCSCFVPYNSRLLACSRSWGLTVLFPDSEACSESS